MNFNILCSATKAEKSISVSYQRGPLVFALSFQLLVNCPKPLIAPLYCNAIPSSLYSFFTHTFQLLNRCIDRGVSLLSKLPLPKALAIVPPLCTRDLLGSAYLLVWSPQCSWVVCDPAPSSVLPPAFMDHPTPGVTMSVASSPSRS